MNVIFLDPGFPANQREFVRALRSVGANVIGIGDRPCDWFDDELKGWLGGVTGRSARPLMRRPCTRLCAGSRGNCG